MNKLYSGVEVSLVAGAGASASWGVASTYALTQLARALQFPKIEARPDPFVTQAGRTIPETTVVPAVRSLFGVLQGRHDDVTFELVLHAIETLQAYSASNTSYVGLEDVRPVLLAFTELLDGSRRLASYPLLTVLKSELLAAIAGRVADDTARAPEDDNEAQRRRDTVETIEALKSAFTIRMFTLNYDTVFDEVGDWSDGFRSVFGRSYARFHRSRFLKQLRSREHVLCHLHGSCLFGYHPSESAIVKYSSHLTATESYGAGKRPKADPAGELALSAPIISGLRKLDKLNSTPYAYYYNAFSNALMRNSRLIIIGYGFNDAHINYWLGQHKLLHGNNRRVVLISAGIPEVPGRTTRRNDFRSAAHRVYKSSLSPEEFSTFRLGADRCLTAPDVMIVDSGFPLATKQMRDLVVRHLTHRRGSAVRPR